MCNRESRTCWLHLVFWWSVAITAIIAVIVSLVIKHERELERRQDEIDSDIKECGC
jgi:ammonia channel protein AmtB